jgi:hypothetical protein
MVRSQLLKKKGLFGWKSGPEFIVIICTLAGDQNLLQKAIQLYDIILFITIAFSLSHYTGNLIILYITIIIYLLPYGGLPYLFNNF